MQLRISLNKVYTSFHWRASERERDNIFEQQKEKCTNSQQPNKLLAAIKISKRYAGKQNIIIIIILPYVRTIIWFWRAKEKHLTNEMRQMN